MSRERCHFRFQFLRGQVGGCASNGSGAAAEGADAIRDGHGVAMNHADIFGIDPEFVGNELGEGSFLTLTVRRCAGKHSDFAGWLNAHGAALPSSGGRGSRRANGADFNIGRNTDAVILALLPSVFLPTAQSVIAGEL